MGLISDHDAPAKIGPALPPGVPDLRERRAVEIEVGRFPAALPPGVDVMDAARRPPHPRFRNVEAESAIELDRGGNVFADDIDLVQDGPHVIHRVALSSSGYRARLANGTGAATMQLRSQSRRLHRSTKARSP
jgi:hypothetical protein